MTEIKKVAVLGSGVMGSGIAAQIANAGYPVLLLDIVPKDASERNILAKSAVERMLKTDPAPFMHPKNARLIETGNMEDDIAKLAECDWIIEVVLEDLAVKHATYEKIEKHRKNGSIVSSNTSTIPLAKLIEGQPNSFAQDFLITHFFNPPRYMRLLEIVTGPKTRADAVAAVTQFSDIKLGKTVVHCNDTPGFIANRILVFWIESALGATRRHNLSVENVDALMSRPIGVPKTGVFGLLDLIGIDLAPKLRASLTSTLPKDDPYHSILIDNAFIDSMISAGFTGRKGKGGFYRLNDKREKLALNFNATNFDEQTAYHPAQKPDLGSIDAAKTGLKSMLEFGDKGSDFAWDVLSNTLSYAASLIPQIANLPSDVDAAMRMGCNWKKGPFELIDDIGPAYFAKRLADEGRPVPEILQKLGDNKFYQVKDGKLHVFGPDANYHPVIRPDGVLLLSDLKLSSKALFKTASAALWDAGDGAIVLEFTGKMNALDEQVFTAIHTACDMIETSEGVYKTLIIYNEGSAFSAGANLGLAIFAINIALWPQIEDLIAGGQEAYKRLKYAPFPVISAPSGIALGGGCEILLHSDHVQAHAETYCGLVEVGVGIIPGWGGCKEMLTRYYLASQSPNAPKGPFVHARRAFEVIGTATIAKSADDAKAIGYFKSSDAITMNRDRLLYDAKQAGLKMAENYTAPEPIAVPLPGPSGKYMLDMAVSDLQKSGKATPYDGVVSDALAYVLSGGTDADPLEPVTEDKLFELEREYFMRLVKNPGTHARIEHMLEKGKPLRN